MRDLFLIRLKLFFVIIIIFVYFYLSFELLENTVIMITYDASQYTRYSLLLLSLVSMFKMK
jgi:hypothetical protein